MNCCDDYGTCTQGFGCPIREEKVYTKPFKEQVIEAALEGMGNDIPAVTNSITQLLGLIYDAGYNEGRSVVIREQLKQMETT